MVKIKKKLAISCILLLIWCGVIFYMSAMESIESNSKSRSVIGEAIEKVSDFANDIGLTNKELTEVEVQNLVDKLNYPLRKVAHFTEYFILTLLLIIVLHGYGVKGKKVFIISLLICFIYAFTDEYHQVFVSGRTGQFSDVLVDTFGGVIACGIVWVRRLIKKTP